MIPVFAAAGPHIEFKAEPLFNIGSFVVTNSMLTGLIGLVLVLWFFFALKKASVAKKRGPIAGAIYWVFEILYGTVKSVIPDEDLARRVTPLATTIFFFIVINYWLGILPGVGTITNAEGVPLFRGMLADLNVTFALAIVTMVMVQVYAAITHGFFGNLGRYLKNPFKDPIGAFEGVLELISEFSRLLALSLRLFGNVFAGEVLLVVVGYITAYFASVALIPVMVFELFIGGVQAFVFFMLTTVFISLGVAVHGHSDRSDSDLSPSDNKSLGGDDAKRVYS